MTDEVELKLELTHDAAEALLAAPPWSSDHRLQRLRSVYFDTSSHRLLAGGFSLRIRETGGRYQQTIKAAGAVNAGLFARPEWERFVDDAHRPMLDDTTPLKALLGADILAIAPVFEVNVDRLVWDVPWNGALVEVALDRGDVVAGERRCAVCEIELELKQGSAEALFSLARKIGEIAPFQLGVQSKSERGYLLLGPALRFVKADPLVLSRETTSADALREIAGSCLRQFRLNEPLIDRNNPEALHQSRVALRRLRSALSIFKDVADDQTAERLRGEVKWLANTLGRARDLDVLTASSDPEYPYFDQLAAAKEGAYADAAAALSSDRARTLLLDLCEWLSAGEWLDASGDAGVRNGLVVDLAARSVDRLRRKVRKKGRDLDTLHEMERHDVRKDAKKLRYAVEFFGALFDGKKRVRRRGRFLAALEVLQDRLGEINDLAVAGRIAADAGLAPAAAEGVIASKQKQQSKLLDAACEAHDAFCDVKPFWR